jgi:hypothetical protein
VPEYLDQLMALAPRAGGHPRMTPANPQEQLEQFPDDWRLIDELGAFGFSLPGVIERPSRIAPPGSRAMTLGPNIRDNPQAFLIDREFAHIHNPPVGSMHMTLPEPYRAAAIAKGWVIRHPFAIKGIGASDAVFVFAPRNREELEWARLLLEISHANACDAVASP